MISPCQPCARSTTRLVSTCCPTFTTAPCLRDTGLEIITEDCTSGMRRTRMVIRGAVASNFSDPKLTVPATVAKVRHTQLSAMIAA